MKKRKRLLIPLLALCLLLSMTGCDNSSDGSDLKDNLVNGWNEMLQSFSQHALTKDKNLKGDKTKGEDAYTGSYTAEYDGFNGEEYLFGGTGLEREAGHELTVTYELKVISGTGTLYWLDKDSEHIIADTDADGTYSITLNTGDNYITFKGDQFSGALSVTVE